jgi:hypothetical protein|uniref:Uncharacterized protein n=1 Tax=viral metagenome TaxID=1070528 RepID=A0A6C0I7Z7_9ZZZZ
MDTTTKPKQNEEKIKSINQRFLSALDDFKKYYVFYNKNPEVDEYSNNFQNSKNQLQGLSGEMYSLTNNIQKNIKVLADEMSDISKKLNIEKGKNNKYEKTLSGLKGTESGSNILISNTKEEYIISYILNTVLFAGILFILALMLPTKFSYGLIIIALIYIYKTGLFTTFLSIIRKM